MFGWAKNKFLFLLVTLFLSHCGPTGEIWNISSMSVILDGDFSEWESSEPVYRDRKGDNAKPGLDLGSLWVSRVNDGICFRIETGFETILQNKAEEEAGNDLRLYIDRDNSTATGYMRGGMGVDLEIHFGSKRAFSYLNSTGQEIGLNDVGLIFAPTHSSDEFEILIPGSSLDLAVTDPAFRIFFEEKAGKDRLPDSGFIAISSSDDPKTSVVPLNMNRADSVQLRVLSHNVLDTGPARNPDPFKRYLKALKPDIINFQEIHDWETDQSVQFVRNALGGQWFSAQVADCLTLSRWPIKRWSAIDGNLVSLIDLPEGLANLDLVLFNAHTPCCGNNPGRDWEHDHIAATWRDLKAGKGPFPIDKNTSMIVLGDLNMVGFHRQLKCLQEGDLIDNNTFGPDFNPSWHDGPMMDTPFLHSSQNGAMYTWRNDRDRFTPGKLDYILYLDDFMKLKKSFSIYTPDMSEDTLRSMGLLPNDSLVSDHLVLVADFEFESPKY